MPRSHATQIDKNGECDNAYPVTVGQTFDEQPYEEAEQDCMYNDSEHTHHPLLRTANGRRAGVGDLPLGILNTFALCSRSCRSFSHLALVWCTPGDDERWKIRNGNFMRVPLRCVVEHIIYYTLIP
jgi:hypothetical protein